MSLEFLLSLSRAGDWDPRHADNERWDTARQAWVPNHTPFRQFSIITYLTTHALHFAGGELVFAGLGTRIEPEAGMLVAFPSDRRYEHEVIPVRDGRRATLAIWFTAEPARTEDRWIPANGRESNGQRS